MNYREKYQLWLETEATDESTKAELRAIEDNEDEIKFRFAKRLDFGTAGLRGTMKAGTNAMNVYTVAQATQGFADLIKMETGTERPVVIAYDSRNNSELFARTTASISCLINSSKSV